MIIREFIVVNFKPIAITENDTFFQLFGAFCEVYEVIPYICSRGKFFRPITMPTDACLLTGKLNIQWIMTLTDMNLTEYMGFTEKSATANSFI